MSIEETVQRMVADFKAENERDTNRMYPWHPIPSKLDALVSNLVRMFMQATPSDRMRISAAVPSDDGAFLTCFAERMASAAVREQSRQRVLEGLIALIIEGYMDDFRSNMVCMAPLYDASLKIGADPQELFNKAATYMNNPPARDLVQFPRRKPEDRSLASMGYKESSDADGFKYERTW